MPVVFLPCFQWKIFSNPWVPSNVRIRFFGRSRHPGRYWNWNLKPSSKCYCQKVSPYHSPHNFRQWRLTVKDLENWKVLNNPRMGRCQCHWKAVPEGGYYRVEHRDRSLSLSGTFWCFIKRDCAGLHDTRQMLLAVWQVGTYASYAGSVAANSSESESGTRLWGLTT